MMEQLQDNCGFALPEVQFENAKKNATSLEMISFLKNRVLIDTSPDNSRDCLNRERILFHELGHVLVQDNPAHTCLGAGGSRILCTKENLIASLVWTPVVRPRGGSSRGEEDPADPEGSGFKQIMANGTNLTSDQCDAIRTTITTLIGNG